MRKDAKQTINPELSRIQEWHEGGNRINYAAMGFESNKYFASDRYEGMDQNYHRLNGKPCKAVGFEHEVECHTINKAQVLAEVMTKVVFPLFPHDLYKMQHDGSLAGLTSVECITQLMTKEFVRNHYAAYKAMYDVYFPALGLVCGSSCGMHVNISNACFGASEQTQTEAIRKLLYITNRHYEFMLALTARDPHHTDYCQKMPQYATMDGAKHADLYNMSSSHGNCFNGSHFPEGRIELRIVGGQRTFGSFRNTVESVFHLVDAVKRINWSDCDDLTKIFAGCNRYVWDRLATKCREAGTITEEQLTAIRETIDMETRYL